MSLESLAGGVSHKCHKKERALKFWIHWKLDLSVTRRNSSSIQPRCPRINTGKGACIEQLESGIFCLRAQVEDTGGQC